MTDNNWNTGHQNAGYWNTGDQNAGSRNAGDQNAGNWNAGDQNAGNQNAGNWNTGNWNTGYFNTVTPVDVLVFNKPCKRSEWDRAHVPDWIYTPSPATWVNGRDMTDAEKKENPTFPTCGGYLKKNNWNEEWAKAYQSASLDDIQAVRDLPNFDFDVFQEITGLDIREPMPTDCAGKTVEIDGIEYVLTRK